jgi:hypothetical protein
VKSGQSELAVAHSTAAIPSWSPTQSGLSDVSRAVPPQVVRIDAVIGGTTELVDMERAERPVSVAPASPVAAEFTASEALAVPTDQPGSLQPLGDDAVPDEPGRLVDRTEPLAFSAVADTSAAVRAPALEASAGLAPVAAITPVKAAAAPARAEPVVAKAALAPPPIPKPALAPAPVSNARSLAEVRSNALALDIRSSLATRIEGKQAGTLDFQQTIDGLSIRLGSIVELLENRYDSAEFARIAQSAASDTFLTLAQLQAAGVPISYDPIYDEFNVGTKDYRPAAAIKVHIDQIDAPTTVQSKVGIDQIPL